MSYRKTPIYVDALGTLQVRRGPLVVNLGPHKQRAVFAALVLRAGEVVRVSPLIDAVWGERPPASARSLVHTYVARLRQALEPETPQRRRLNVIDSAPNGYRLLVDGDQIDVARFHRLWTQAKHQLRAGESGRAFSLLGEAVRLWRDPWLHDLAELLSSPGEVEKMRHGWVDAVLAYVTLGLDLGAAQTVWPLAEQLAKAEPTHEEAQARYLVALNRTGQRATAIAHYSDLRAWLRNDLGVEPGPQLTAAYRQVLLGDGNPAERARKIDVTPPTRPPWRGPGPSLGDLIHRDAELAALTGGLSVHRLATLSGPPGCGKSALALHAAAQLQDTFLGGVLAADCSDLTNQAQLNQRLLDLLAAGPDFSDVPAAIGGQQILIVLDNVEHIVDSCAAVVDELVRTCREVSVIVTSREPLGLPDETVWRVPPLAVPDPETPDWPGEQASVELLVLRATRVRPDFELVPENAATVAAICRRLDGLPLALEMAAACLATDTLDGLLRRLDDPLHEIQPLRRGRPSYHRSLRSALLRSVDCLTGPERWVFLRLSRLPAVFHLPDAQRACHSAPSWSLDVSMLLTRLVDKSLLFVRHGADGPRYHMLSLVHRLAAELAAEPTATEPPGAG